MWYNNEYSILVFYHVPSLPPRWRVWSMKFEKVGKERDGWWSIFGRKKEGKIRKGKESTFFIIDEEKERKQLRTNLLTFQLFN